MKWLAALLALNAAAVGAQDVFIHGAKVHTVDSQGTLETGNVLIRGDKVVALGHSVSATEGATVIEANGRPLTPGLFGGLSAIGLEEVSQEEATVDENLTLKAPAWQPQWRPEFDVLPAFNPRSVLVPVARIEGLTWTMLAPGSAGGDIMLAGQGAAVTLDGRYDAALAGSRALFVYLGSDALQESAGSRAAQYMLLEQAVQESQTKGPIGENALLHPAGREVLAQYLKGGRVVFKVHRAADILQVLAFARHHNIRPIVSGGAEAWVVARDLARAHVPVLLDALQDLPASFDSLGARLDNAALLERAGVRIAFTQYNESHNARKVRQLAGNAVAHGLPWEAALAALTANPAEIFGQGATRGRIAPGQIADLVLWSGDPLEVTTAADRVWIAGRAVEMRSRQTELRDRYLNPRLIH